MRRILFSICALAALAVLPISCNKSFIEETNEVDVFSASIEGSKVSVGADGKSTWNANDKVAIISNSVAYQYSFQGADGDATGTFASVESTAPEAANYYAVYPFEGVSVLSESVGLSLPSVQTFVPGKIAGLPLIAASNTKNLSFSHVCGVFHIYLAGTKKVSNIVLSSIGGEPIWGDAIVDFGTKSISMNPASGQDELTLDCGEGVQLNASGTNFYFYIPAQTYSQGLKVSVNYSDGSEYTQSAEKSLTITKNQFLNMAALNTCNYVTILPADCSWNNLDLFNVGATDSEGNTSWFETSHVQGQVHTDASEVMLFRNTSGYLANITNLSKIVCIELVNFKASSSNVHVYVGNEKKPSATEVEKIEDGRTFRYNVSGNNAYCKIEVPSGTALRCEKVIIYYEGVAAHTPEITSVTTSAATNVKTETGTTATLNGAIEGIEYTAANTTCGFEYKMGAGEYTNVDAVLGSNFSVDLTGLTAGTTYTYRAWAKVYGGEKVYGEPVDFTPISGTTIISLVFHDGTASTNPFDESMTVNGTAADPASATFTLKGTAYQFPMYAAYGKASKIALNSTNGLQIGNGAGTYVVLPVVSGKALTKVAFTSTKNNFSVKVRLADGSSDVTAEAVTSDTSVMINLSGLTSVDTQYRLENVTANAYLQIKTLELTYEE